MEKGGSSFLPQEAKTRPIRYHKYWLSESGNPVHSQLVDVQNSIPTKLIIHFEMIGTEQNAAQENNGVCLIKTRNMKDKDSLVQLDHEGYIQI